MMFIKLSSGSVRGKTDGSGQMRGDPSGDGHAFGSGDHGGGPDAKVVFDLFRDGKENLSVIFERNQQHVKGLFETSEERAHLTYVIQSAYKLL